MPVKNYKDFLYKKLRKKAFAANYLTDCFKDSPEAFLVALKDVVDVYGGFSKLSGEAELSREHLYRMLSKGGNPRISSLAAILQALGMGFQIVALEDNTKDVA